MVKPGLRQAVLHSFIVDPRRTRGNALAALHGTRESAMLYRPQHMYKLISMPSTLSIAIIGAGLAGISAARHLSEAGHQVQLFDKSRGSGGRLSSKRTEFGDLDIGAQYFTAREPGFRRELKRWLEAGWVADWEPQLYLYEKGQLRPSEDDQQRFIGMPRMTGLSRQLLEGLSLTSSCRIQRLRRDEPHWWLEDDQGSEHGPFDRVVVAAPAPQAAALLEPAAQLAQAAARINMLPCWAVALVFEQPLDTPVQACFVRDGALDWISRNSSKAGRKGPDSWVIHASTDWSAAHVDDSPLQVIAAVQQALAQILGCDLPEPVFSHAHRWLYARPAEDCQWGALAAPELGLYACGDWCLGGRVENAWLSGRQVARTLVGAG